MRTSGSSQGSWPSSTKPDERDREWQRNGEQGGLGSEDGREVTAPQESSETSIGEILLKT